jgi:hypothetical protein
MNFVFFYYFFLMLKQINHHLFLQLLIVVWIVIYHCYLLMEVFSVIVVLNPVVFSFINWFFYFVNILFETSEFHVTVSLNEDFFELSPVFLDNKVPRALLYSSYNKSASSIKEHFKHSNNASDRFSYAKDKSFINFESIIE